MPPVIRQREQDRNAQMVLPVVASAAAPSHTEEYAVPLSSDLEGNIRVILGALLAGEDVGADVQKTEERYLTSPVGGTDAMVTADQLYKSNAGYVRSITMYSDATATAGTIALRDSTVAGAGNILWSFDVLAVAYNTPFTVDLQTSFSVGLFLDFTTTADVKCMVRFR